MNLYDMLLIHQQNRTNNIKDKRTFGLVIQGGGMRGAYTAGAQAVLIEYGLVNCFDHIIGASAGAINATYYLAKDIETSRHTYGEDLTNKNFVNLLRSEKRIDVDYAIDTVLKHKRPVNFFNLNRSKTKLHIILTDAKTGKKVVLSDHQKFAAIYEELRATSALPLLYDKKVLVNGQYYVDGGVSDNLPVDVAVKLGCTDIVVFLTQQIKSFDFSSRHSRLVNHLVRKFSRKQSAAVRRILPSNERLTELNLRRMAHPTKKIRFYILEPSNEEYSISMGTIDKPKVKELTKLGISDMDAFLHSERIS